MAFYYVVENAEVLLGDNVSIVGIEQVAASFQCHLEASRWELRR
ncbi:hypothetical protein FOIG_01974 [Fusarium odoratissimum NRRL 54006]|uniref:Uncharacterized protein n=1 Tax=Fusarium odoratissimum (strain NRRL 54006) TaxID=1089451 RepID=X0KJV4_FUSO5|nr:uncharacterized protein FOIG_01974 [Fusarium odoratissimum NRRL 54006]EXM08951.1 hypothetical protein FOIG_01974 [Fusarium odoratissimum NRRL 54006]